MTPSRQRPTLPRSRSSDRRDPVAGLAPSPYGPDLDRPDEVAAVIGTREERLAADGYDVDAVLAASQEFRSKIGRGGFPWMCRGEALHIAQALRAVK